MLKAVIHGWCLVILLATGALASHPLITDDAGTQGRGGMSLELNGEASRDRRLLAGVTTRDRSENLNMIFTAGFTESADVVLSLPWSRSRTWDDGVMSAKAGGIGDLGLEVKWRLLQLGGFSCAIKPTLSLPTGDVAEGLGAGRVSYGTTLIATQEFAPFFVHVNAGYSRREFRRADDRDAHRADVLQFSTAVGAEAAKGVTLVANVGVESSGERASRTWPAFILGGIIWSALENLDLDIGVKGGLSEPATDLALLAGMTLKF